MLLNKYMSKFGINSWICRNGVFVHCFIKSLQRQTKHKQLQATEGNLQFFHFTCMKLGTQLSNATKVYCETACLRAISYSSGKEKGCKKNANSGQQKDLPSHAAATGILVLRYANIMALRLV